MMKKISFIVGMLTIMSASAQANPLTATMRGTQIFLSNGVSYNVTREGIYGSDGSVIVRSGGRFNVVQPSQQQVAKVQTYVPYAPQVVRQPSTPGYTQMSMAYNAQAQAMRANQPMQQYQPPIDRGPSPGEIQLQQGMQWQADYNRQMQQQSDSTWAAMAASVRRQTGH